jgi:hypothetical protein
MENGIRADLLGSKPHSNGDILSRLSRSFLFKIELATIRAKGTIAEIKIIKIIISSLSRTF